MDNKILYTAKFTHHDFKFHKVWWKSDKRFGSQSGRTEKKIDLVTLTFDLENQQGSRFSRTKYVPSLVKIHGRMLILECSQGCYGRTEGSVTISLRNAGEGINNTDFTVILYMNKMYKT